MLKLDYICDRCGKAIQGPYTPHYVDHIRISDLDKSGDYIVKHLCPSCMRGLWNYLEKRVISYSDISKEEF